MSNLIDRLTLRAADTDVLAQSRSRRWLLGRLGKTTVGSAGAVALASILSEDARAGYSTYVVQNNTPCRSSPNTWGTVIRYFNCGNYIYVDEVNGGSACGCNECTNRWAQVKISPTGSVCYIHRGNLNPYRGGACECP